MKPVMRIDLIAHFFLYSSDAIFNYVYWLSLLLQWSPTEADVFASCSVDGNIAIWDIRIGKSPAVSVKAHNADVNVISWNR